MHNSNYMARHWGVKGSRPIFLQCVKKSAGFDKFAGRKGFRRVFRP